MESRVKVSDTPEDGYQWRKYGQKEILNSKFPRLTFIYLFSSYDFKFVCDKYISTSLK